MEILGVSPAATVDGTALMKMLIKDQGRGHDKDDDRGWDRDNDRWNDRDDDRDRY